MSLVLLCVMASTGAGERLYREGLLPSGRPVQGVAQSDVAVTGAQLTCAACHGRSGLGSSEGDRLAAPITPAFLDAPRTLRSRPRPAYTRQTLLRALREGVDAGGNTLDALMPRYRLTDAEAGPLLDYLATLSARPSPGASLERLHFATVITPGVDQAARRAMLAVLRTFFERKNAASASNRGWHSPSWQEYYGHWQLHVWELTGSPSGWKAQLEARLAAQPVFAVVSGLGAPWGPVHDFCEAQALPCLLSNAETPPGAAGYYSLYFSRGLELEAAAIAARLPAEAEVLQVSAAGGAGAAALRRALGSRVHEVTVPALAAALRKSPQAEVVLWLDDSALRRLAREPALSGRTLYLSATLLASQAPPPEWSHGFVAQPFALPAGQAPRLARVSGWLSTWGVTPAPGQQRIEDQTFFALTVLSEGVMHLRKNFHREYLLEVIDHTSGLESLSAFFPRLSFGPGQRALSKGCYLVPLRGGAPPEWVVP